MRKILLILVIFSLTACTQSADVILDENSAKPMNSSELLNPELNALEKNQTSSSANNQSQSTQNKGDQTSQQNNTYKINEEVKNMNTATLTTNKGKIVIKLDTENAPISSDNFKKYVINGFYDGTIFHRVMSGFMIQGGGFTANGDQKKTEAPIKNEAKNGLKNNRGTLAMARTMVVDSATSQFFINLVDNDFLNYQDDSNYGYAVFGEVTEGMDVVDMIAGVKTTTNGMHENWPIEDIVIESAVLSD